MTRKQIVLIQPQLASLDGHEHTQIKALEWLMPGHRLTVVTRQGCTLANQFENGRLLQLLPAKPPKRRRRFLDAAPSDTDGMRTFGNALVKAFDLTGASPSDLLLVPSAGPDEIAALVDFIERDEARRYPAARLRILSEDAVSQMDEPMRDRLRRLNRLERLILYTETTELCRRIRDHHRLPVHGALHLPCTILPGNMEEHGQRRSGRDEVRVGILGRQRSEKGSYRIPAILRHLRRLVSEGGSDGKICLVYQAVRSKRLRRLMLEVGTRFGADRSKDVRIEFLESGMSAADFRRVLLDMDVLLLPYDISRYRYSGSGIITDAVVARKPVVHTRGMAMRDLLQHGNAEAAETDQEFAEKLLRVATQLPRYQSGTRGARDHLEMLLHVTADSLVGDRASLAG